MELFKLFATLSLNSGSFERALSNSGKGIGGFVKQLGLTQLALSGVEKGFSAITDTISKSVDNYANYEQLVGGVETLFKQSAGKVQQYAQEAYKTAGVSQNDYMTMVTDFSASLINSLGGDTSAAADVANRAIIDMSDNVNKMGNDMTAVQNAYKGFSKGNFTMLDNLKLGYGGTKEEMERLLADASELTGIKYDIDNFADITKAIGVIQDKLEITGTTAKEAATTISGSKSSMQAAFSDLLTTVATGDQGDFNVKMAAWQESFITYINGNLLPTVTKAIGGSGALAHGIMDAITMIPTDTFGKIAAEAEGSLSEVFKGFTGLAEWIVGGITDVLTDPDVTIKGAAGLGASLGTFIGSAISDLATNLTEWVPGILEFGLNFGSSLVEGIFQGVFGKDSELDEINKFLSGEITGEEIKATEATGLLNYMQTLIDKEGEAATQTDTWKQAVEELKGIYPEVGEEIEKNKGSIRDAISLAEEMVDQLRQQAIVQSMNNALQAKYNLVAEQTRIKAENDVKIGKNQGMVDEANAKFIENVRAYATEAVARMEQFDNLSAVERKQLEYAKGLTQYTGKDANGNNLDSEQIFTDLETMAGLISMFQKSRDQENPWDKDQNDNIISPEAIEGLRLAQREWQDNIDKATKENADAQAVIDQTNEDIAISREAIQNTLQTTMEETGSAIRESGTTAGASIEEAGGEAAGQITAGGSSLGGALNGVASQIRAFRMPGIGLSYTPFATGIDDVPYDNFPARLHRGEMVLTQAEANDYRRGGRNNSSVIYADIEGAITSAFGKVGIYLGAERVGDLTTSRTKRNIDQQKNHTLRGMGG